MVPYNTRRRKRDAEGEDWKWLLWESGIARETIHPELGAGWTAVLKEACCARKDEDKDKVNWLREDVKEPLKLWPKEEWDEPCVFKGMVVTVPLLEWCVRRKYKPDAWTFMATARGGDMEAVKWLREHKCPWHQDYGANACLGAAEGGHLKVLKWLRKEGCPWDRTTCGGAAKGGHLDVLKYMHRNGCPWDLFTCSNAALGGHMDVLKYARENRCPWDKEDCLQVALQVAGRFRKQNVIDWISQQTE